MNVTPQCPDCEKPMEKVPESFIQKRMLLALTPTDVRTTDTKYCWS